MNPEGDLGLYSKHVNAGELAYYQIQLTECIELTRRKDEDMRGK